MNPFLRGKSRKENVIEICTHHSTEKYKKLYNDLLKEFKTTSTICSLLIDYEHTYSHSPTHTLTHTYTLITGVSIAVMQ